MTQHIVSVKECMNRLSMYSAMFKNISTIVQTSGNEIAIRVEYLKNLRNGDYYMDTVMTDDAERFTADSYAREIIYYKNQIEAQFNNYWHCAEQQPGFLVPVVETVPPQFNLWLREISSIQQLFSKQQISINSNDKIELHDIQRFVELAHCHVDEIKDMLISACAVLMNAKEEANQLNYSFEFTNLCALYWLDLSKIYEIVQIINNLKISIYKSKILMIDLQPNPVIMKLDKKPQSGTQRERKATTRTDISVKLINLFSKIVQNQQINPFDTTSNNIGTFDNISIKIGLINESTAQEIQRSNVLGDSIQYQGKIYSCEASASTKDGSVTVQNFDKFVTMSMKMGIRKDGSFNNIFEAHVPNISVISVGRNRKNSDGDAVPVTMQKYYFLITAQLPTPQVGLFIPNFIPHIPQEEITAWTISSPVIIRTHSEHKEGALAVSSWNVHFATHIPHQLRNEATIEEIRNLMKFHFHEWTCSGPESESIILEESHLDFLQDWLLEHVSNKSNIPKQHVKMIPLKLFYFEKMVDRDFSFWSWFHKAVTFLNRNCLKSTFKKGYIKGFIGKDVAYNLLEQNNLKTGNFIIRFSQSVEAELSIVFVEEGKKVSIFPMTIDKSSEKTFQHTFLTNIYKECWNVKSLRRTDAFLTVYPNTPKRLAFPGYKREKGRRGPEYVDEIHVIPTDSD